MVYANSEDGFLYAIGPDGSLRARIFLNLALGAAYTPLSIGGDGILYTQNYGHLFAVGNPLPARRPVRPTRRARARRAPSGGARPFRRTRIGAAARAGSPRRRTGDVRRSRGLPSSRQRPRPRTAAPRNAVLPPAGARFAVFVVHGMGEQIPFQTLELVAEGLRLRTRRRTVVRRQAPPVARACFSTASGSRARSSGSATRREDAGGPRLRGLLGASDGGQVRLRDVVGFLFRGAANGIWNAARKKGFRRWTLRRVPAGDVPASRSSRAARRARSRSRTRRVERGDRRRGDRPVAPEGPASLARRRALRRPHDGGGARARRPRSCSRSRFSSRTLCDELRRPPSGAAARASLSVFAGSLAIGGISLAGLSLPLLFWSHIRCAAAARTRNSFRTLLGSRLRRAASTGLFELGTLLFIAGAVAFVVLVGACEAPRAARAREWRAGGRRAVAYFVGLAGVVPLLAAFAGEVRAPRSRSAGRSRACRSSERGIVVAASLRALRLGPFASRAVPGRRRRLRRLPHPRPLRTTCGARSRRPSGRKRGPSTRARGADGSFLYAGSRVVGHSLGSVIAYDTLNRLILDDEAAGGGEPRLGAVGADPLFLTFGSPLDKTAFIFGVQGKNTTEAREALAASVQPMICDYRLRPRRWVNVHSPWDLVSGSLDLYDSAGTTDPRSVENVADRKRRPFSPRTSSTGTTRSSSRSSTAS